jgi:hypothetical protein
MNPYDISNEILTTLETDKLIALNQDPVAFGAIKKYILAVCYKHGVIEKGVEHKGNVNWALRMAWGAINEGGVPRSDEELGQNLRAMACAVQIVESGFKELSELKLPEKLEDEINNPAE